MERSEGGVNGYPGAKGADGVFHRIIGQMPPHDIYIEPFFGSGQIFWRKRRAPNSILIDRNPVVLRNMPRESESEGVEIILGDAFDWLPLLAERKDFLTARSLVYCDPPYVLQTRRNRRYYAFELSDSDHSALLLILRGYPCRVMISGYRNALYDVALHDWRRLDYVTMTRGGARTESLWCNFAEPETLHDWRFAGNSFRQRHNFRRAASNLTNRLRRMTPRQRGFVLAAIQEAFPRR